MDIDRSINYWRYRSGPIHPQDPREEYLLNWKLDRTQGIIQQMLVGVGDVSDIEKYPDKKAVQKVRADNTGRAANCWDLCHTMRIGDIVFAVGEKDVVLGVGRVTSEYYFVDEFPRFHRRDVDWLLIETHEVHHGLEEASLMRFDLRKSKNVETLSNLMSAYGSVFGIEKIETTTIQEQPVVKKSSNGELDYIGKRVFHKTWGNGVVLSIENNVVMVKFSEETKRLAFPMVFDKKLLSIVDN